MPTPWISEFDVRYQVQGQLMENAFHVLRDTDEESLDDLTDLFDIAVHTAYKAALQSTDRYLGVFARDVVIPGGTHVPEEGASAGRANVGTGTGTIVMSPAINAVFHLKTHSGVRGAHGWFRPPPPLVGAAVGTAGHFDTSSSWWTACLAINTALVTLELSGSGWGASADDALGLVVYSRRNSAIAAAPVGYAVRTIIADSTQRWLRSRRPS